jgi:hypothetical protein
LKLSREEIFLSKNKIKLNQVDTHMCSEYVNGLLQKKIREETEKKKRNGTVNV